MLITSASEESARTGARVLAAICREKAEDFRNTGGIVAVLGPSPSAYLKLRNRFRWQVFIKTWTSSDMQKFVEWALDAARAEPALRGVQVTVDRDPASEI
jgi:primosomal protein N'